MAAYNVNSGVSFVGEAISIRRGMQYSLDTYRIGGSVGAIHSLVRGYLLP